MPRPPGFRVTRRRSSPTADLERLGKLRAFERFRKALREAVDG